MPTITPFQPVRDVQSVSNTPVASSNDQPNPQLAVPFGPTDAAAILRRGSEVITVFRGDDKPAPPDGHTWVFTGRIFETFPVKVEFQSYPNTIAVREGDGLPGVPGGYKYVATGLVYESLPPAFEYELKSPDDLKKLERPDGIDPSTIAKIEDVRFSEIPYAAVESRINRALKADDAVTSALSAAQIAQLADSILNPDNNDRPVGDLIAGAIKDATQPVDDGSVSAATVEKIEEVRFLSMPWQLVLDQVHDALKADAVVAAKLSATEINDLASALLNFNNMDRPVADVINEVLTGQVVVDDPAPAPAFDPNGVNIGNVRDVESAGFTLASSSLEGDELTLRVRYGGGMKDHSFELRWDGGFMESFPVQANVKLIHTDNGDPGEALLGDTLTFDLSKMKESYQSGYQTKHGEIRFSVAGERFSYKF